VTESVEAAPMSRQANWEKSQVNRSYVPDETASSCNNCGKKYQWGGSVSSNNVFHLPNPGTQKLRVQIPRTL